MRFGHQEFSKALKVALNDYLFTPEAGSGIDPIWFADLKEFDLDMLVSDAEKTAFWINIYNGFTNYQIISNQLQNSVWEKADFFTDRGLKIGAFFFSLDDIEHGILRCNRKRRNNKPLQFAPGDPRARLMLKQFDYRIHFALNCGSISCPALAYYSEKNLDQELKLATQNFTEQEFLIDDQERRIECSQLFVWYREDFGNLFLNDPELSQYRIIERPYHWKIK